MKRFLCGVVALGLLVGGSGQVEADYLFSPVLAPNSFGTDPLGINNAGQIVGAFTVDPFATHSFLLSGGNYTTIDPPGSVGTLAYGINASSQIVGTYDTQPSVGAIRGFLLSQGSYTTLTVPGAIQTFPGGINNTGMITGTYYNLGDTYHGFLLNGGKYTTLDVPGSLATYASGINDTDQIVGYYRGVDGNYHGFLYSNGSYLSLDEPGSQNTLVYGINNLGQIVGDADMSVARLQAFVLSDGNFIPLNVPGADTSYGRGINDAGQIAGYFTTGGSIDYGFFATPVPEPATLLLIGMGALGLAGWAWRRHRRMASSPATKTSVVERTGDFNLCSVHGHVLEGWAELVPELTVECSGAAPFPGSFHSSENVNPEAN